jgi:hypothetical protein
MILCRKLQEVNKKLKNLYIPLLIVSKSGFSLLFGAKQHLSIGSVMTTKK